MLMKAVNRMADTILPWRCVVCGLECSRPGICEPCKASLPWNSCACGQCGLPLATEGDPRCGACLVKPPVYDSVVCPLLFRFPVNRLIHQFKFNRKLVAGSVLGAVVTDKLLNHATSNPDLLIPVPMHRYRLISRGLNPAYELARQFGKSLGLPLAVHDLQRARHTPAQSGLDAIGRRKNLKGAFRWHGADLKGKNVTLVDDVMTTGSTLAECSRVLKRAGAAQVTAWTLARAVRSE